MGAFVSTGSLQEAPQRFGEPGLRQIEAYLGSFDV